MEVTQTQAGEDADMPEGVSRGCLVLSPRERPRASVGREPPGWHVDATTPDAEK